MIYKTKANVFKIAGGSTLVNTQCEEHFFFFVRKLIGSFSYLSTVFLPGFLASLTAILVEKKSRRGTLALYMTNLVTVLK